MGRITIFLLVFVLVGSITKGQLLVENFDYGASEGAELDNILGSGFICPSGNAIPPLFTTTGLTYDNSYPSQGIGGATKISAQSASSTYKLFSSQVISGNVFISFLLKVESIPSNDPKYIIAVNDNSSSFQSSNNKMKFMILKSGSGFKMGIIKDTVVTYSDVLRNYGTTYCVVLLYQFVSGTAFNDQVAAYVYEGAIPGTMPLSPTIGPNNVGNDIPVDKAMDRVVIRQESNSPTATIDGIRVGTTWATAPLPVELTSFTAKASTNSITLNWSTATEIDNFGFEIERSTIGGEFKKIGFVSGAGNSNSTKEYSYTDTKLATGKYNYRLKQIDNGGTYEYSNIIETEILPTQFELKQNYPNPFNPSTTISFALAEQSQTRLEILNPLGESVATLVDGNLHVGTHVYQWDATGSASGVYLAKLTTPTQVKTIKMLLVK